MEQEHLRNLNKLIRAKNIENQRGQKFDLISGKPNQRV